MPLLQYKAMDERGKKTLGQIEAVNVADLEMRLSRMGLDLINFKEVKVSSTSSRQGKVRREDLIAFCFHLEQLTSSGVPVLDGLVDLRDSIDSPRMREVVAGVVESIGGGKNLSDALAEYPQVFDVVFVNLIRAGEYSGKVGDVLRSITANLKWQDEQAALIKKLVMYPMFVGSVVMLVVLFLMTYLVPQLVSFIANMGQELPIHTKVLLAVSDFFVSFWWLVMITPILLFVGFTIGMRASPSFAFFVDTNKLRIWMIGPIMKKMILARFASYFALLYSSGITVL